MATLQKFKLLATHCAVAGSPTRSPTTSPVIHLRRRKTLRMLLSRNGGGEGRKLPPRPGDDSSDGRRSDASGESPEKEKDTVVSHKLRDLFVSSPPPFEERKSGTGNVQDGMLPSASVDARRGITRPLRPLSATFRQRLLRRAWRPVLGAIPESHYEN
ncbi:uncharacterized protein LOC111397991 [Olea europaea var. sylvestris]|uniref:uncharacterized protein LOC111397991 n=1 Tax=Olea europaea var. sylvestris TaxID=158386 RepID=UPI000C1D7901|nr:uncharacterized protein LOC111397991 [Olea europaea var. sylvestris]